MQHWKTVVKRLNPDELTNQGFLVKANSVGELEYHVTAQVCIKYRGEKDIVVGWKIMKPRSKQNVVVWEDDTKLWDANSSEWMEGPTEGVPMEIDG